MLALRPVFYWKINIPTLLQGNSAKFKQLGFSEFQISLEKQLTAVVSSLSQKAVKLNSD